MKKSKLEGVWFLSRQRWLHILILLGLLYLILMGIEIPLIFLSGFKIAAKDGSRTSMLPRPLRQLDSEEEQQSKEAPVRPIEKPFRTSNRQFPPSKSMPERSQSKMVSGLMFTRRKDSGNNLLEIEVSAMEAWELGKIFWKEINAKGVVVEEEKRVVENYTESCVNSISLTGLEFKELGNVLVIPCGMTLGSQVTLVGKPLAAHLERNREISFFRDRDQSVLGSQFVIELQGLKTVDGEDPPRILHFNPRLKGDWSTKPVIELNTCYRMQWGWAVRCEGWKSNADEETVDGQVTCEKWLRDDNTQFEGSKTTWWLNRLVGREKKVMIDWPYPFTEDRLFVLTISAGFEGYHITVDGRHVSSFPYRTGFVLEDATGLSLNGDVEVHSIFAGSLPTSHPSYAPQRSLEMSREWQAPPLTDGPVELFIGILSAGNHFAERMAVRKSWMQSGLIKSSTAVARFFVALHGRKEVNAELKKEAEFFGDIVIVPFMDSYDLVVLKTVAICEYGVRTIFAKYIMKCDDDTFVRVDTVLKEARRVHGYGSLYVGNMNYYHKPLRNGKWAVTYEEWPEEDYPPYANGPGYIISSDIANFVISEFERNTLRLFKMEDVSMGMWVELFNSSKPVGYRHDLKFCQFGCIEEYYTAHYQSPRQMICLWDKLQMGKPQCCNMK